MAKDMPRILQLDLLLTENYIQINHAIYAYREQQRKWQDSWKRLKNHENLVLYRNRALSACNSSPSSVRLQSKLGAVGFQIFAACTSRNLGQKASLGAAKVGSYRNTYFPASQVKPTIWFTTTRLRSHFQQLWSLWRRTLKSQLLRLIIHLLTSTFLRKLALRHKPKLVSQDR